MAESKSGALVEGSVTSALRKMAVPMAFGMVFMIMVNIIDTFWVARLGTAELAAMTFTFPVVGLVINLALGLMIGTSTAVARAIGSGHEDEAARLTTHALYFSFAFVGVVSIGGLLGQDAIFAVLGAEPAMIEMIKDYMTLWWIGVVLLVAPLIANGALRAKGDAKTPMKVMMLIAVANAALDPIFIFGWGPVPALGLEGAAIATLIARVVGAVYVFWVLLRKTTLLTLHLPQLAPFVDSVRRVLSVGVPAAVTNALGPLAVALITGIVATYGEAALAGYGIGARLDAVVLIAPYAVGGALSPFVGQNWGAHLTKRVAEGIRRSLQFVIIWGLAALALLVVLAKPIASVFTDDPAVAEALMIYLYAIPIGYAPLATVSIASASFNAVDRAIRSTWLSLLRTLVFAVPAAYIGGLLFDLSGVFIGLSAASLAASIFGIRWLRSLLDPDGTWASRDRRPLTAEESQAIMDDAELAARLGGLLPQITALEDVTLSKVRNGLVGFFVGERELAHIHPDGRLDLPLPIEVGENLTQRGVVTPHRQHEDNGWFSHSITSADEVDQAVWLLRLAHLLYEMSRRGIGDPVTQAELAEFTVTEQCVQSMLASARRWQLDPEPALS